MVAELPVNLYILCLSVTLAYRTILFCILSLNVALFYLLFLQNGGHNCKASLKTITHKDEQYNASCNILTYALCNIVIYIRDIFFEDDIWDVVPLFLWNCHFII